MYNANDLLLVGSGTSDGLLINANQTIYIFLGIIAFYFFCGAAYKVYQRIKNKRIYYIFPRISTKGISNISLVISISASIILLLTIITAGFMGIMFRAYPGTRITVEGLLIKIGGLIFGPIIGMFIGAITDLLAITLTAGMFHPGYFIAAISYGLFSGTIRTIINFSGHKKG
jgi:hypothetical protein